jgi:hypothetical protein
MPFLSSRFAELKAGAAVLELEGLVVTVWRVGSMILNGGQHFLKDSQK